MFILLFLFLSIAGEPEETYDVEIEVIELSGINVFVDDLKIINNSTIDIDTSADYSAMLSYATIFKEYAKIDNGYGGYEPVSLNNKLNLYGLVNVNRFYKGCDYKSNGFMCSVKNYHYYIKSVAYVDQNELEVRIELYDKFGVLLQAATKRTYRKEIFIKQVDASKTEERGISVGPTGLGASTRTTEHLEKESLPLKYSINHKLLNKHIQEAFMYLWLATKFKKE